MNKKRTIVIVSIFLILLVVSIFFLNLRSRISEADIKNMVLERKKYGENYMNLIEKDGIEELYYDASTYPHINELKKFIKVKYIERIVAYPNEYIIINIKNLPQGFTGWGIYYQKNNKLKGHASLYLSEEGTLDENTYTFDGCKLAEKQKIIYETERICENWFFFREKYW